MWLNRQPELEATNDWEALSRVCDLSIGPEGRLEIRLKVSSLGHADLQCIVDCVETAAAPGVVRAVAFDFAAVELIAAHWTAVPALLIRLVRRLGIPCLVHGLAGQPAGVFALYRRCEDIRRMLPAA